MDKYYLHNTESTYVETMAWSCAPYNLNQGDLNNMSSF